jgi:hypothetical protein
MEHMTCKMMLKYNSIQSTNARTCNGTLMHFFISMVWFRIRATGTQVLCLKPAEAFLHLETHVSTLRYLLQDVTVFNYCRNPILALCTLYTAFPVDLEEEGVIISETLPELFTDTGRNALRSGPHRKLSFRDSYCSTFKTKCLVTDQWIADRGQLLMDPTEYASLSFHVSTEKGPVSKTLSFLVFAVLADGQSRELQYIREPYFLLSNIFYNHLCNTNILAEFPS